MRLGAGRFGGRNLESPVTTATRPMADLVRAALFDVLGDISGQTMLDLFAGTGAVGFEALSRGASGVVAIESNGQAARTIKKNLATLGLESNYQLLERKVEQYLSSNTTHFDLIVADPPYAQLMPAVFDSINQHLKPQGVFGLSQTSKIDSPRLKSLELVKRKDYGDTALSFYRLSK